MQYTMLKDKYEMVTLGLKRKQTQHPHPGAAMQLCQSRLLVRTAMPDIIVCLTSLDRNCCSSAKHRVSCAASASSNCWQMAQWSLRSTACRTSQALSSRGRQRTLDDRCCSPDQHRRHAQQIAAAQAALPAQHD